LGLKRVHEKLVRRRLTLPLGQLLKSRRHGAARRDLLLLTVLGGSPYRRPLSVDVRQRRRMPAAATVARNVPHVTAPPNRSANRQQKSRACRLDARTVQLPECSVTGAAPAFHARASAHEPNFPDV